MKDLRTIIKVVHDETKGSKVGRDMVAVGAESSQEVRFLSPTTASGNSREAEKSVVDG